MILESKEMDITLVRKETLKQVNQTSNCTLITENDWSSSEKSPQEIK